MRKLFRKICTLTLAATVAASAFAVSACAKSFKPVEPDQSVSSDKIESNGGFVVASGDYYYFINGIEDYTADNTYGNVVKGALKRVKKSDVNAQKNTAETVIPSLMVSADYSAGIFLYGEGANARIYYATPNDVKNTSGKVESDYLRFKSAKIDGSDVRDYFSVADNATVYRYVELDGTVYLVYVSGSELHSYNTATGTDTLLVGGSLGGMQAYVLNSLDKTDPYIYYTASVKSWIDSDAASDFTYNQIYRVRADATQSVYEYTFDEEYLTEWQESNEGAEFYVNYGEIVLDGLGFLGQDFATQFSPDFDPAASETAPTNVGYTYTLQSYTNDGIYFIRKQINNAGSTVGTSGELYYLAADELTEGWNSISGNDKLEVVASAVNTSKASTAAIFYIDEDQNNNVKHHYLYVSGTTIFRADVLNDGKGTIAEEQGIAFNESGATLVSLAEEGEYKYVYYTKAGTNGGTVERVAYNGTAEDYKNLIPSEDFKSVRVLQAEHANNWYNFEIIDNNLFIANAEAIGASAYNYTTVISLSNASGNLMTASELEKYNELYDLMMGEDGYIEKLSDEGYATLATAVKYYYYTGKTEQFYANIDESVDLGKKETYLYTEEVQNLFKEFTEGKDNSYISELNGDGAAYRLHSYFLTLLGEIKEDDQTAMDEYWQSALERYTVEEEEGLAWWAWLLIGLAIGIVVIGAGVFTVLFLLHKKKAKGGEEKPEKLKVDTSDDKEIDVYAQNEEETEAVVETQESATAEEILADAESVEAETPVEDEPVEAEPIGEAPVEAEPVEEPTPVEEAPVEAAPVSEAPVEAEPVEEPAPAAEEPVAEEAPAEPEPANEDGDKPQE